MRRSTLAIAITLLGVCVTQAQTITFYTPSTVRVLKEAPNHTPMQGDNLSLVVRATPQSVNVRTTDDGQTATYSSVLLTVKVNKDSGKVSFYDASGNLLVAEAEYGFSSIDSGPDKGRYAVRQEWRLDTGEAIYGFGMMQNGKMNMRGVNRLMIQENQEDFANVFQSIKGYGIYWDNYSPTALADSNNVLSLESQVGAKVDYYFMYGQTADGVISEMRHLSGKVPMSALWTFGFHQSRERYKSCNELLEVLDTYRSTGVPIDGMIQDWQYWGNNYLWNAMEFLNSDFANYKHMIDHVHKSDAHLSISIWASFGPHTKPYHQLDEKKLLYSFQTWPMSGLEGWPPNMEYPSGVRCYVPYSVTARNIYWENLLRLHTAGIDGWWMDSTDPDHLYWPDSDLDEVKPVTDPITGTDFMSSWRFVRNAFPLCTVNGVYDSQRAVDSSKRVFILTRSYFAGQQRTGAQTWSGDIGSSWDSFRKQVPLSINYTFTANPNVNNDLGGFFANSYNKTYLDQTATKNPLYQELYVRWMQFGTFLPMMRSHGTEVYRELYYYGKSGEPVYDALLDAVKLRYKLLPYIYSTAWQVSHNDDSYVRGLMMDFPSDTLTWDNGREFMFGRSLLVAPVLEALYTPETANETDAYDSWSPSNKSLYQDGFTADWNAIKTYDVYLPKGAKWFDYWTGELFDGGQIIKADGTLKHCPLYVKSGSILPICLKNVNHADIADWTDLDIYVYPGGNATFTLYEDEGDNYNYEKGVYSTIKMDWDDASQTLTIGNREGSFPGMSQKRTFRIHIANTDRIVNYVGKKIKVKV